MSKQEVEDLNKISIFFLKKHDYFRWNWRSGTITWTISGAWGERKSSVSVSTSVRKDDDYLQITYTQTDNHTEEKKDFDYKIPLTTTDCNYGGIRYWFICPWYKDGVYCGKRVGTLYKGGDYFACRHCYDLTYKARKENRRHSYFPLFNTFEIGDKIEKIEKDMKIRFYNGKPTKKYKKILKLDKLLERNHRKITQLERDILL